LPKPSSSPKNNSSRSSVELRSRASSVKNASNWRPVTSLSYDNLSEDSSPVLLSGYNSPPPHRHSSSSEGSSRSSLPHRRSISPEGSRRSSSSEGSSRSLPPHRRSSLPEGSSRSPKGDSTRRALAKYISSPKNASKLQHSVSSHSNNTKPMNNQIEKWTADITEINKLL